WASLGSLTAALSASSTLAATTSALTHVISGLCGDWRRRGRRVGISSRRCLPALSLPLAASGRLRWILDFASKVDLGTVLQERSDGFRTIEGCRKGQRCLSILGLSGVGVRAPFQQQLHCVGITGTGRHHQRSQAVHGG